MTARVGQIEFFVALKEEMNGHPERYATLGDADMAVMFVMRDDDDLIRVVVTFEGIACRDVFGLDGAAASDGGVDFRLEGDRADWEAMFDNITTNGRATGLQTINSLALMGDRIWCAGDDPMGLDKFSRFNQTLQEYLDGAAHVRAVAA